MGTLGTHTIRIANLTPCDDGLKSKTACGAVLEFADIIALHDMDSSNSNTGGWPSTGLREYLNNNIYNSLPIELQRAIIDTKVVSGHGPTAGETNFTSNDKLYLLSTREVWAQGSSNPISGDTASESTRQLDYYKNLGVTTSNYSGAIKKYNGSNKEWWLRAATSTSGAGFYIVNSSGGWNGRVSVNEYGVSPAFRIA